MSIITSIHQPNQYLFQMFDSVYVLAKEGVCVYSGLPQNLRQHLNECRIECTENQIPIEVLIKLSFNGITDNSVQQLVHKTEENQKNLNFDNLTKREKSVNNESKPLKIIDFWYLLIRYLYRNYVSQRKYLFETLLLFSGFITFIAKCFNTKISEIDGCFHLNSSSNMTCLETEEEKFILSQNQVLIFFTMFLSMLYFLVSQTASYSRDLNFFRMEYQNSK